MQFEADNEMLHAGTYSGNPMVLAAMDATLDICLQERQRVYPHLARIGEAVCADLREVFEKADVAAQVHHANGVWQVFFCKEPVTRARQARRANAAFYHRFQQEMQARGIYFHDDPLEVWFASTAHSDADVALTLEVAREAIAAARQASLAS